VTECGIEAIGLIAAGDTSEFSTCLPYVNDTIFTNGFDFVTF
jgi:hypothetical protein